MSIFNGIYFFSFECTGVTVSKSEVIFCLEQNKETWIVDREDMEGKKTGNLKGSFMSCDEYKTKSNLDLTYG